MRSATKSVYYHSCPQHKPTRHLPTTLLVCQRKLNQRTQIYSMTLNSSTFSPSSESVHRRYLFVRTFNVRGLLPPSCVGRSRSRARFHRWFQGGPSKRFNACIWICRRSRRRLGARCRFHDGFRRGSWFPAASPFVAVTVPALICPAIVSFRIPWLTSVGTLMMAVAAETFTPPLVPPREPSMLPPRP